METVFKNFKPTGGKLLKIAYRLEGSKIAEFRLRGDFFMHPESALEELEDKVLSLELDKKFIQELQGFLSEKHVQLFGFTVENLYEILTTGACS
tara:strand:- start:88 stop:369 length:282 start_codon:yes stop_codon:yes gene_type:complete